MIEIEVSNPSSFDEEFASIVRKYGDSKYIYVYVYAEKSAETGQSWCPDCVKAEPYVRKALAEKNAAECVFVTLPVVKLDYKSNPEFFYRKHPKLQLKAVPSLYGWTQTSNSLTQPLIESECWDQEKLNRLIKSSSFK